MTLPHPHHSIRPHQIRRLLASNLLDDGIHEVAERLGHDPGTLMRYTPASTPPRCRQASEHIARLMDGPPSPGDRRTALP
jgi:integrase